MFILLYTFIITLLYRPTKHTIWLLPRWNYLLFIKPKIFLLSANEQGKLNNGTEASLQYN